MTSAKIRESWNNGSGKDLEPRKYTYRARVSFHISHSKDSRNVHFRKTIGLMIGLDSFVMCGLTLDVRVRPKTRIF